MNLAPAIARMLELRAKVPRGRAALFAVSGIDGSGKSTLAPRLAAGLREAGLNTVQLTIDAWHYPPVMRFSDANPGEHFYRYAFRWEEFFGHLVEALQRTGSVRLTTILTRQPENDFREHTFAFDGVDAIVLEGIFLFKREFRPRYDLAIWVDCSFETALERALARNQEGISAEQICRDYDRIYFAAQRVHFARDNPRAGADLILPNDHRLLPAAAPRLAGEPLQETA